MNFIRNISSKFPILSRVEKEYKIPREYTFLGIISIVLILIMSTPIGPIVTSLIGIMGPLKETLLVLKQVNPNKEEIRHLLIFWLIFGLLTLLDAYSRFIIGFIPLFYTIKFLVLLYIGPFKFRGTSFIYENLLKRIPEEWYVHNGIDSALKTASDVIRDAAKVVKDKKTD